VVVVVAAVSVPAPRVALFAFLFYKNKKINKMK